jgi:phosphoribosyl-ATP pyrophosphohydrolase/phosphoribosyl-AMP cyclohydrolase
MIKHEELESQIKFDENGLVPVVVQSNQDNRVLMVAWTNLEAVRESLRIGETVFYSRSRQELWHKGATSGNIQRITKIEVDCDGDTLLYKVEEAGVACHNGTRSCFDTAEVVLND